jgi:sarcosine oxidase subunit gamma
VDELRAISPFDGALPVSIGALSLVEVELGHLTSIAPFKGRLEAASTALMSAHGLAFPAANRVTASGNARAIWFGRDMALLVGAAPDPRLASVAALTDQSDAWAAVSLSGKGAEDVLARLVPVDLRATHFKEGHTVRSLLGHMNASVTRTSPESFLILVFRSMAGTLAHDITEAMEAVAARG